MANFANSTLRLLRRMLGPAPRAEGPYAGVPTVLDGNSAIAVTEASLSETAALGAGFPTDGALLAWRGEQARQGRNLAGAPLTTLAAEGPRGALATATGLTLAGTRAACFLSSPDLAGSLDLLTAAAGRHLPLVVHVANRALPSHAATPGSCHEALHLAADTGCFILVAASVQQAVDFTLIARQVAEQTLVPGLVVIDGGETAMALQEVRLAPPELIREWLGSPDDEIPAPTPAQALIFGETRRRIPRWHHLDRPALLGGVEAGAIWGLGSAARQAFFASHLAACLDDAFHRFQPLTGRCHGPISSYQTEDSPILLLAQGATIETAQAVADGLRGSLSVGVVGIHALRPFPGAELARLLSRGQRVCVLERVDSPLDSDPPLLREVRAALGRALDNGLHPTPRHPGYPALNESRMPSLLSVIHGLGGAPLRAADLAELCQQAGRIERHRVYLGLRFVPESDPYPKRQVLLDRLHRAYPDLAGLGLTATQPAPMLRPKGVISIAIQRLSGQAGEGLLPEIAVLLHHVLKGQVRGRPALTAEPWGALCTDRITLAAEPLRDPGEDVPIDLALITAPAAIADLELFAGLTPHGVVLFTSGPSMAATMPALPPAMREALEGSQHRIYYLPAMASGGNDYLLGGLCGALVDCGLLDASPRRLVSARESLLKHGIASFRPALEAFKSGLEAVRKIAADALEFNAMAGPMETERLPAIFSQPAASHDGYDGLPRFWDQVGVLHQQGATGELVPDPYLALGLMPAGSAGFRDLSCLRTTLPAWNPALCSGCGACLSVCPEAATGMRLFTARRLLETGIQHGGGQALSPLVGRLAKLMARQYQTTESSAPANAGELLRQALAQLREESPLPPERATAIGATADAWMAAIGDLPLAATAAFFHAPDSSRPDAGALLSLAIDPATCKSCGLCVANCPTAALRGAPQDAAIVRRNQQLWERLRYFPTHSPAVTSRGFNPLAALLLVQQRAAALHGGDGAEPGSGARLALRLVLSAAEASLAPAQDQWRDEVRSARESIAKLIHSALADALPADDLDALAQGLATVDTRQAELGSLIGAAEARIGNTIDTARLRRLVSLAQGLGNLHVRLESRHTGGRACLGVALTTGLAQGIAGAFPWNPYPQPVTVDLSGDGAALAAGLLEGQLRVAAADFALVRRARLELDNPREAPRRWAELAHLHWRDLTARERAACPSLLLAGGSEALVGRGLVQLFHLLGADLPIRVLVLADLDMGLMPRAGMDSAVAPVADGGIKLGLLALAQRQALVAQSSIAAPDHLVESCQAAFAYSGPALLHLHAPSPARHGFPTRQTLARADLATASRLFPLFRYDPAGAGVFGMRLSLAGNPAPRGTWSPDASCAKNLTPAHWALGEERFAHYFTLQSAADDPAALEIVEYLALDDPQRAEKIPVLTVTSDTEGGAPCRYRVHEAMIQVCDQQRDAWRTLQELAGLVTPFTARVQAEAEATVAKERQAELAAQQAHHERLLERLRADLLAELRHDVRERLLALAGYPQPPGQRVN